MNETKILEIKARIASCEVQAAGMMADNKQREIRGESMAWPGSVFFELAEEIDQCAGELIALSKARGES